MLLKESHDLRQPDTLDMTNFLSLSFRGPRTINNKHNFQNRTKYAQSANSPDIDAFGTEQVPFWQIFVKALVKLPILTVQSESSASTHDVLLRKLNAMA